MNVNEQMGGFSLAAFSSSSSSKKIKKDYTHTHTHQTLRTPLFYFISLKKNKKQKKQVR